MICDTHDNLYRYSALFRGVDPSRLFEWLRGCRDVDAGTREEFCGDKLYVSVMRMPTVQDSRWEAHREYVDLQFIAGGGEVIEWSPVRKLTADGGYLPDKDVQFFESAACDMALPLREGLFVFFFPSDAHRPLLANGSDHHVYKAVVKIHHSLLVL